MKHWHLVASSLTIVEIGGRDIALQAAMNFRYLRGLGVTVYKTIDTLIATRCIKNGFKLLHDDRDFDPFVKHLGLKSLVRVCPLILPAKV